MIRRVLMAGVCMVGLAFASSAVAQENATLVLKSGQRITGELVDLGGVGFTMRVNGSERRVPTKEVAVVDFAGNGTNLPSNEANDTNGQGIVLSSGQAMKGTLYDIGGTQPLKITMDLASGGQREFNSNDVRRIYLARPSGSTATATTGSTPTPGNGTVVPANQRWVDTGITVRRGQQVTFNATGEIQLSADPSDKATPDGSVKNRYPTGAAMRNVLAGALVGRIGVATFGIGTQKVPLSMPAAGRLYLGVNDDSLADNSGEFRVEITPGPGGTAQ